MHKLMGPYRARLYAVLRIVTGLLFFLHGLPKLFGGFGRDAPAELMSQMGLAGIIEVFGGFAIMIGLFTSPIAFLASGEMAVAYFWKHWGSSGEMWWWDNRGELVMVYSFLWLFFAVWGAGPFSLDAWRRERGD